MKMSRAFYALCLVTPASIVGSHCAFAQSSTNLPPIVIEPVKPRSAARVTPKRTRPVAPTVSASAIPAAVPQPHAAVSSPSRAKDVMPAYAGGQVATGAGLGFLGNRGTLETPFNIVSYTAELAANQGARTVADVAANDPSVRSIFPRNSYRDVFTIRGVNLFTYNVAYGGLFGMLPKQRIVPEIAERIEILKGPDTFMNGVTVGGSVGGNINIVPKRAPDIPIAALTTSFASNSQPSVHLDYGQRFGEGNEFGVRFNAIARKGGLAVDGESEQIDTAVRGLDYRGERTRVSLDLGYQIQKVNSPDWVLTLAPTTLRPPVPDGSKNLSQPWAYTNTKDAFAVVRGEYDLSKSWTAFASFGQSYTATNALLASPTLLQPNGNFTVNRFTFPSGGVHTTGEAGIRGKVDTGPVTHNVTVAGTIWDQNLKAGANFLTTVQSNIYNPVLVPAPSLTGEPMLSDLKQTSGNLYSSVALADTLSILNDRILLTLGGRYQRIESQSYNGISGVQTASYDKDTVTPAVGVIVKVRENVALYANYVEGLQQGPTAPVTAVNFGQIFAPTLAKQVETGVKVDWGRWTSTFGVFEISQANGITDPTSLIYSVDGQQRNRGLEFNVFGEPVAGFRMLGGFALIDGVQVRTAGGALDGKTAIGVPAYNINLGVEMDVPIISNFTLSGRAIHTASQFVNATNTQSIPEWTRFDLGARYVLPGWNGKPLTLRFNVENVLDTNYYASASTGQATGVSRGAPRTFIWSATALF